MHNELLTIGPITIYTYGLMIAIGIFLGYLVGYKRGKKMGLDVSHLDSLALWAVVSGFAGAKILYWITRISDIPQDPSILWNLGDGWVVYGGIIGGILGGWYYCKRHQLDFLTWSDLIIPEVALAQCLGRLGCYFAGCCYGIHYHSPISSVFPEGSLAPSGIPLFPTQLLSSAYNLLMFLVLIWIAKKATFKGETTCWYLIIYSVGRFFVEFLRGDLVRGGIGVLSTSQIISIFILIGSIVFYFILKKRYPISSTLSDTSIQEQ